VGVSGGGLDLGGDALSCVGVADREGHLRAGCGERTRGLGADTGCSTGHDDPAAGQIDPGDNLGGGGFPFEGRGDRLGHRHAGSRVFGGTAQPTLDFMGSDAVRRRPLLGCETRER
jgi:hypothetical protein